MLRCVFVIPIALGCNFSGGRGAPIDASEPDAVDAPDSSNIDATIIALDDTDLVVRYFMDEADSGQMPPQLADLAGVGVAQNLEIVTAGPNPAYTSDGQNRGLRWIATDAAGEVNGDLMVLDRLQDAIDNADELTIELVLDVSDGSENNDGSVVLAVGSNEFVLNAKELNNLALSILGVEHGSWDLDLTSGRAVVHIVLDSNELIAADRLRLFRNGTLVASSTEASIDSGAQLMASNGDSLVLGNADGGAASLFGTFYYAAIYGGALSATTVGNNAVRLLADDDQ